MPPRFDGAREAEMRSERGRSMSMLIFRGKIWEVLEVAKVVVVVDEGESSLRVTAAPLLPIALYQHPPQSCLNLGSIILCPCQLASGSGGFEIHILRGSTLFGADFYLNCKWNASKFRRQTSRKRCTPIFQLNFFFEVCTCPSLKAHHVTPLDR